MQNITDKHGTFVFDQLYGIIAFRGSVATAIIFSMMVAFIIARDALGIVRWGMPPREVDSDIGASSNCQYTPDHSGH